MTALIVYIIIPLAVLALLVAFITIIVKSIWRGRSDMGSEMEKNAQLIELFAQIQKAALKIHGSTLCPQGLSCSQCRHYIACQMSSVISIIAKVAINQLS